MTAITASPPLRRAVPLRIGLVLATLLAVAGAVPALMIGLDGSAWDPIVIIIAVLSGGVALGTLALVAFAWNGRRGPCIAIIALQIVSILPALPAFLLPAEETGPGAASPSPSLRAHSSSWGCAAPNSRPVAGSLA